VIISGFVMSKDGPSNALCEVSKATGARRQLLLPVRQI
jgi:hypothetical protein